MRAFIILLLFSMVLPAAGQPEETSSIAYSLYNLPLVVINTNGEKIPDEPRIRAQMKIINNGEGQMNKMFDPPNEYNGYISIELRGETTLHVPKKSYSLELQLEDGSNNNVSVFGFPAENDFVLYAPYSDKTFMRNVLVYKLFREMDNWSSRTQFVEVILNNEYDGIYVWMEKIKRDENRVDIDKLDSTDVAAPEITGGYILRRDKTTGMEPYEYWKSPVQQIYYEPLTYQYFDPDYYELTEDQRQYIRDYMQEFDEMMSGPGFDDPEVGYPAYIDVKSFVDMMIVNEFSKGLDCYMFSTYFYKQNDEDGGKFFAGPPWDYNISLFNVNYGYDHNIPYVHSWVYDNWSRIYWWKRLMEDEDFEWEVLCRWEELRHGILKKDYLFNFIDKTAAYLGDAVSRNFETYPILGEYVWPNKEWPPTYSGELKNLKSWIEGRLNWVDSQWGGVCEYVAGDEQVITPSGDSDIMLRIRPNPSDMHRTFVELSNLNSSADLLVEIFDIRGTRVYSGSESSPDPQYQVINLPDLSRLSDGIYLIRLSDATGMVATDRLVKGGH